MNSPLHFKATLLTCALVAGFGESLVAQTAEPSKPVREAAELAEGRRYAEAVRLLELAMIEGDTSEALIVDLSGYYKKVGNLRMATALCKPLVDRERPRPWHLLEVATMLVDQGRFTEAEPYLRRFDELKPDDDRAERLRAYARSRHFIAARYPGARLDTFIHNTGADDGFPVERDGTLYWSSDREGSRRTSGWTGRPMVGLYTATRDPEAGTFGPPARLDARFNRGTVNTASPWPSASGDTLYFSANAETANRLGELNMQLYFAIRHDGASEWRAPERVATQFEQPNCLHPSLSPDGRWLYFAADGADSRGGLDLYRVAVQPDGTFGRPQNLGADVNSERHDAFPVVTDDGRLVFASQGHIGLGGFDLFETRERPDGTWTPPVNLGEPINGEADETGWFERGARRAYLVSDRVGGDDDIYEVAW